MSFDTPIQQVVTFSSKEAISQKCTFPQVPVNTSCIIHASFIWQASLLAVRTHAVVSVLKLQSSASFDVVDPPIIAETVIPISVSETGKRRIVDMSSRSFPSSNPQILLVNDTGIVYNCQIQDWGKAL